MAPKQEKNEDHEKKPVPKKKERNDDTENDSPPPPQAKKLRLVLPTKSETTTSNISSSSSKPSTSRETKRSREQDSEEQSIQKKIKTVKDNSTETSTKETDSRSTTNNLSHVTKSLPTENQNNKEEKNNKKSEGTFKASKEVEEVLKTLIADIKKAKSSESPTSDQEIIGALLYITTSGEVIIQPNTILPTTDQEIYDHFFAAETPTQDLLGKEESIKASKRPAVMMTVIEEEAKRQPETSREGARREQRERGPSIKGKEVDYNYMDPKEMTKEQRDQLIMLEHYKLQKDLKDKQQRTEQESATVSEVTREEQQTTTEIDPTVNALQNTSITIQEEQQTSETVQEVSNDGSLDEQQIVDTEQELLDTTSEDQTTTTRSEESSEGRSSTEKSDESLEEQQLLADIQKVLDSSPEEQQHIETTLGDVPEDQASIEPSSSDQIPVETAPESQLKLPTTVVTAPDQPRRYRNDQPAEYPLYSNATWDDLPPFKNILRGKTENGKFMVTEMVCFADLNRPPTFANTSNSVLNRPDDYNSPAFDRRQPIRTPPQHARNPVPIRARGLRRSSAYRGRGFSDRGGRYVVRYQGRDSCNQSRAPETDVRSAEGGDSGTEDGDRVTEIDVRGTATRGRDTDNRGRGFRGRGQPSTRRSGSNILNIDDILKGMTKR